MEDIPDGLYETGDGLELVEVLDGLGWYVRGPNGGACTIHRDRFQGGWKIYVFDGAQDWKRVGEVGDHPAGTVGRNE